MALLEIREVTRRFGDLAADIARLEMLRDFDPVLRRTLSRLWTEIKVR